MSHFLVYKTPESLTSKIPAGEPGQILTISSSGNIEWKDPSAIDIGQDVSDLRVLSGTVDGDTDLGTFTGTTIADASDVKAALQALETSNELKIPLSEKGTASGVATLDAGGKVPVGQLPSAVMTYEGMWNASTNSPTLADGIGDVGAVYRVGTAGSQNLGSGSISFSVGDYAIYNGSIWEKSATSDSMAIGATIGGSPATGSVLFVGTSSTLQNNTNLTWDNTNNRFGIGTAAPSHPFNLVHSALSGTASYLNMTGATATGNVMTMDQSGTSSTGRIVLMRHFGLGRGLEIISSNAANTNAMAVMTGTHAGYGLTVTTSAGAAQNYTATFSNLSTAAAAPVSGGVYGSVRSLQPLSAGVVGEVIGSGTGSGFFAVRNAAGTSIGLATNLGAGVFISPSYAMSSANNYALTLPLTQGAAGTTLSNDGTGILSWVTAPAVPSIGGTLTGSTAGRVIFGGAGSTFDDDDGLFYDDANNRLGISNTVPLFPVDIGRAVPGETEAIGFTYTPDPIYRNYITSASGGSAGQNQLRFWLRDPVGATYVSPLTLSDEAAIFSTKVVLPNVGINTTAAQTPLGSLEINSTSGASYLVMSLSGDRSRYATVKNSFGGTFDIDNLLDFYVQNAAASQVKPLTLRGDNASIFHGNVGIGTVTPTEELDVNGSIKLSDLLIVSTSVTPASASATGTQGTIAWDANYIYICTAADTWKRVGIATWP